MNEVTQKSSAETTLDAFQKLHEFIAGTDHGGLLGIAVCVHARNKDDPSKALMHNMIAGEINALGAAAILMGRAAEQHENAYEGMAKQVSALLNVVDKLAGQNAKSPALFV